MIRHDRRRGRLVTLTPAGRRALRLAALILSGLAAAALIQRLAAGL